MKFLSATLVALATSTSVTFASPVLNVVDSLTARNNDGKGVDSTVITICKAEVDSSMPFEGPVVDLGPGGKYRGVLQVSLQILHACGNQKKV